MTIHSTILEARHQELAGFLRSRRERLSPADVSLAGSARRRTPGLRREEVALLAGVGTTWYTWLEQGRDVRPSAEVLTALARALKLDAAEKRYLFTLADRPMPESLGTGPEIVPTPLLRMLASMTDQPAYVLGRRWDILAWNHASEALFGDYGRLVGDERNTMHLLFADATHQAMLLDWDELARMALAMFRADCARYTGDPDFERLVARLTAASPEFSAWWGKHEVMRPFTGHKRIAHPVAGHMTFEYTTLSTPGHSDIKLVVYTALDAEDSAGKLARLLRNSDVAPFGPLACGLHPTSTGDLAPLNIAAAGHTSTESN